MRELHWESEREGTLALRLFVAINLPPALCVEVAAAAAGVRALLPDARWVETALLHITVKFIGAYEGDTGPLASALDRAAADHRPTVVTVSRLGAFPNLRRPRVVWMGVQPDPKLELLFHDVERELAEAGVEVSGRPFRPHVTLARLRERPALKPGVLQREARREHFSRSFSADRIELMSTEQREGRLRYHSLHAAPIGTVALDPER